MENLVFLLSLVLLCSGCKYFKKSSAESVETITADTMASDEMIDSSAYYSDAANAVVETQATTQYNNAVIGKYYMIVGCFTVSANADRYAEKLRGMGYESQIIPGNGRFQMVTARTYSSFRESVNDLDKFRNEVTPNAWVYLQR